MSQWFETTRAGGRRVRPGQIGALLAAMSVALCACSKVDDAAVQPTAKFHLEEATIRGIQAALLSGGLTTEQLVRLYLARIKAYNGTCVNEPEGILGPITTVPKAGQINALSTLNLRPAARKELGFDDRKARSMTDAQDSDPKMLDALETARAQDQQFKQSGKLVGPLHGVVIAIKDQYDTFDMRTTSGADAPYANDRPPTDATFVKRLRDAGAIVLAKANLGEYASGIPRSSFGGTFCNPYDTERSPRGSSSGSGSAVAANLVTCAIAEETGSSIRGPASAANTVGIAPTQELVSRQGMIDMGINTRVGPICRTVEDAARVLDAIAGYDPLDQLTAFTIGRMPTHPYESFAHEARLDGVRIGVVREYMNKQLFTKADEQTIDLVSQAALDLGKLGATIVDPGAEGELFTSCIKEHIAGDDNKLFTKKFPELFPLDKSGKPSADHVAKLVELTMDPGLVPDKVTLRNFSQGEAVGQSKYQLNLYLAQRGDANIKSNADLIAKSTFHGDGNFPDRKKTRENVEKATELNMAERMLRRFSVQQIVLQCMGKQQLDALIYPTSNLPPTKLGAPSGPTINGRSGTGPWSFLGQQGFPVISVPAGFTTEVYDLIRDPAAPETPESELGTGGSRTVGDNRTRLVGPTPAILPVGMDIVARPFNEPLLLKIAASYEAATKHRKPPSDFGPLPGEP